MLEDLCMQKSMIYRLKSFIIQIKTTTPHTTPTLTTGRGTATPTTHRKGEGGGPPAPNHIYIYIYIYMIGCCRLQPLSPRASYGMVSLSLPLNSVVSSYSSWFCTSSRDILIWSSSAEGVLTEIVWLTYPLLTPESVLVGNFNTTKWY